MKAVKFDEIAGAWAAIPKKKRDQMTEDLVGAAALVAGAFFTKRKLKKLGFSKGQVYVIGAALTGISGISLKLDKLVKELRAMNAEPETATQRVRIP